MFHKLKELAELIRHGNSLNAERASHIKKELETLLELTEDNTILRSLDTIIHNQTVIMDQNAAISGALDQLGADISAELQKIASSVQPGMTDEQAQALVDRINGFDAQIQTVLNPAASTSNAGTAQS